MRNRVKAWPSVSLNEQGGFITNPYYTEIIRLHEMLEAEGIPHEFTPIMDGWQVAYPAHRHDLRCVMDAIEHHGSYGHERNLLEIAGLLTPQEAEWGRVVGYMSAREVFDRIRAHWTTTQGEEVRG